MTKRSLNRCGACGDTWYPRGRELSKKCPSCGSTKVAYNFGCGEFVVLVALIAWLYWYFCT